MFSVGHQSRQRLGPTTLNSGGQKKIDVSMVANRRTEMSEPDSVAYKLISAAFILLWVNARALNSSHYSVWKRKCCEKKTIHTYIHTWIFVKAGQVCGNQLAGGDMP